MPDKIENLQESTDNSSSKTADSVIKSEKDSDREGLTATQQQKASDIKTGKQKSGVTDLLGKPDLLGSDGTNVLHAKGFTGNEAQGKGGQTESSESKAKKGPEGEKKLGEYSKPGSEQSPQGQLERDKLGRPNDIKYPDGTETKVKYDDKGNVDEVQSRNGDVLKRNGDGNYDVTRADGTKVEYKATIAVSKEGDVVARSETGETQIRHANGEDTRINSDNSQVHSDINGKVKQVTYPSGESEKISYDKNGQPTEVKASDNSSWKKGDDGWNHYDKNGKPDGDKMQDIQVRQNGVIDGTGRDGEHFIQKTDGTEDKTPKTIQRDSQDRPTSVTYPDGKTTTVKYDANGNAEELHTRNGDTMKRVGDGQYDVTRADGSVEKWNGTVAVDKNGNIVARDASGATQVRQINGDETNIRTDQSQVTTGADGKVKDIVTPDGKHMHMTYENGELSQIQNGDTTLKKDGTEWGHYEHGKRVELLQDVTATKDGVVRTNQKGRVTSWGRDGTVEDTIPG